MRYLKDFSKYQPNSKFMNKYASLKQAEDTVSREMLEKEQFKVDYKKGNVRTASANKFMSLKSCGLGMYVDEDTHMIWKKEGDRIVRVEDDLSWVDEFLKENKE